MHPAFVCFLISLLLLSQPGKGASLVGEWEFVVLTEEANVDAHGGEIHQRWHFRSDGSLTRTIGIESHGTYKVEGQHLITSATDSDSKVMTEDWGEVRIEGNSLVLKSNGEEIRLGRLSRHLRRSSDIVGRWGEKGAFFHQGPNGLMEVVLMEDGRTFIKVEGRQDSRYKVRKNLLTISNPTEKYRFRSKNGVLFLKLLGEHSADELKLSRIR